MARTGTLSLPHARVSTPAFMPVGTAATVKAITHRRLEAMGYTLILGNTYHLYLRPGSDRIRELGGLHRFSAWNNGILTDSGGFQVFSLSNLRTLSDEGVEFRSHLDGSRHVFTPEKVVQIQTALGSDIQMQLDVCTGPDATRDEASEAVRRTTEWAVRAKGAWTRELEAGYAGYLFPIVQGNFHADLRRRSVEELVALGLPGIAIGGLSVGEEPAVFKDILAATAPLLPEELPHYLMGVGTPDYLLNGMANGIDMFDCVFPTRIARNGTVMTWDGRVVLKNERHATDQRPIDTECGCDTCRTYSRAYLRHLFQSGEVLGPMLATEHNLFFYADFMRSAREAISRREFSAFAARTMDRFTLGERERRELRQ